MLGIAPTERGEPSLRALATIPAVMAAEAGVRVEVAAVRRSPPHD
jgi:hypothetical protein